MMERLYTPTTKPELYPTTLIAPARIPETHLYPESLSSYITRLAQAHQLSAGLLFTQFIQPRVSSQQKGHLLHRCTDGYAINGAGYLGGDIYTATKSMVSPLESSTFCSFYFLADLIGTSYRNLLSKHLKWCPICLTEGNENYYPLYWQCQSITCCIRHKTRLASACPHCNKTQQTLTASSSIGTCTSCRLPLFKTENQQPSPTPTKKELWIAQSVNELTTSHSQLSELNLTEHFRRNLRACCSIYGSIRNAEFQLGFAETHFQQWLTRNHPNLPDFIELCYRLNTQPSVMLSPTPLNMPSNICYIFPSFQPRKRQKIYKSNIETRLEDAIKRKEVISIKALSRNLGSSEGYLQQNFRSHLDIIISHRKEHLEITRKEHREKLIAEAAELAIKLMIQGKYFGGKSMAHSLSDNVGFKKLSNILLLKHLHNEKRNLSEDIKSTFHEKLSPYEDKEK